MTEGEITHINNRDFDDDALDYHAKGRPGKLEIKPTKPMGTQRDLSLAYSPGVAAPVKAIHEDPSRAPDYTAKGNSVAVISNGSAILGLGNLGALASKPVMEGKAVLFKRFADIDAIDLEVDAEKAEDFINAVRYLSPSFGGVNLEDIKAPDCFIIEQKLRELMTIPVFHDDQHGTAIIAAAGLINALFLTKRDISKIRLVCNGAGSAGIACLELVKALGVNPKNAILCDSRGVIYKGRKEGMNQWKSAHAVNTKMRTLEEALDGADVFFGLSVAGALTDKMVAKMAKNPIIFAMANPDPEITPEAVEAIRDDAIMATGRSDYPNQVNNVLGFPYIFRGALDVRASQINEPMKIAAAKALAHLAREDVPDDVAEAYRGMRPRFGPEYIIPAPFDPRLIARISPAVAQAAMDSGVATLPIIDMDHYAHQLAARLDPMAGFTHDIFTKVKDNPKRVIFAEGEQPQVVRAANMFLNAGLGTPILIGREDQIQKTFLATGIDYRDEIEIINTNNSPHADTYAEHLYNRLQRKGYFLSDCERMVNTDRMIFSASMVAAGHADGMVAGVTRNWASIFENICKVLDPLPGRRPIGFSLIIKQDKVVIVADTSVHDMPTAIELADISQEAATVCRRLGYEPRVALLAYSTFGHPEGERSNLMREAVEILDNRGVDFEYDGEMGADIALNKEALSLFPFCRLSNTANVLIMPAFHSASISTKMMQELGDALVIGPLLVGLEKSVQIAHIGAKDTDLLNLAALAAFNISE